MFVILIWKTGVTKKFHTLYNVKKNLRNLIKSSDNLRYLSTFCYKNLHDYSRFSMLKFA